MKHIIFSILVSFTSAVATAQMDIPGDGGNIRATISEDIGIPGICIKYSRPRLCCK